MAMLIVGAGCAAPAAAPSDPPVDRSAGDALSHRDAPPVPTPAWFVDVAAAPGVVAALDQYGTMWVWGRDIEQIARPGHHEAVTVGQTVACALDDEGTATCVPLVDDCEEDSTAFCDGATHSGLRAIAAGQDFVCGLDAMYGTIECWGRFDHFRSLEGPFADVYAAGRTYCGRRSSGIVTCAGGREIFGPSRVKTLEGRYASFAMGRGLGCGLDLGGDYRCERIPEGDGLDREALGDFVDSLPKWVDGHAIYTPPIAALGEVSLGLGHGCAVGPTGRAHCWGDDRFGQATPPPERFSRVVTGDDFSCGLDPEGGLTCWGGHWSCIGPAPVGGENECGACGPIPTVVGGACGCSGRVVCGADHGGVSVPSWECEESVGTADAPILLDEISDRDEPRSYRGLFSERSEVWFTLPVADSIFGYYAGRITLDVPPEYQAELGVDGITPLMSCDGDTLGRRYVTDTRYRCDSHPGLPGPLTIEIASDPLSTHDNLFTIRVRSSSAMTACVPFELHYEF